MLEIIIIKKRRQDEAHGLGDVQESFHYFEPLSKIQVKIGETKGGNGTLDTELSNGLVVEVGSFVVGAKGESIIGQRKRLSIKGWARRLAGGGNIAQSSAESGPQRMLSGVSSLDAGKSKVVGSLVEDGLSDSLDKLSSFVSCGSAGLSSQDRQEK